MNILINLLVKNVIYSLVGIMGAVYLSRGNTMFDTNIKIQFDYSAYTIAHYLLFVVCCSICSVIFFKMLYAGYNVMKKLYKYTNLLPIVLGVLVAGIANASGPVSIGPGINALNSIFLHYNEYDLPATIGHIGNIIFTFLAGCSGGLIVPSIAIGSYLGFFYHKLTNINLYPIMLIGITSFLSVFMEFPLSCAILIQTIFCQEYNTLPVLIAVSCLSCCIAYLLK